MPVESLLWVYAAGNCLHLIMLVFGAFKKDDLTSSSDFSACLVIPALNAGLFRDQMRTTVKVAQGLALPSLIFDDGSVAKHARILATLCSLTHTPLQISAVNRGKVSALQSGIEILDGEFIVTVDADTVISRDGILRGLMYAAGQSLGALAMTVQVKEVNCLTRFQAHEYYFVLDFARQSFARLGFVATVPGAAAIWRRTALNDIGGFSARTLAEDTDATIALQCAGWRVSSISSLNAETCAPVTLPGMIKQRRRWIWGNIQASIIHIINMHRYKNPIPAVIFALITWIQCIGFILSAIIPFFILISDLSIFAFEAITVSFIAGIARISVSVYLRGSIDIAYRVAVSIMFMQIVNILGFWSGVLFLTPIRSRWR